MKTLFTLFFAAACCIATSAKAQRIVDLSVTLNSVVPNVVDTTIDFTMQGVVTNVGTTPTKITDTVLYAIVYNNAIVSNIFFKIKALNPNDTLQLNFTTRFANYPTGAADSTKNICFQIGVINRSADSVKENATANNISCLPITLKAMFPASVEETVAEANAVNVYPNPTKGDATFNVELNGNSNVTIKVYDISGRVVIEENRGELTKGNHAVRINTEKLQNGLYLYQVSMGKNVISGKLSIAK